ncbi:MAG TPA: MFS transporter [Dehalococcoidia bacterium]|nr:MFS transporter [Dehalococcoidia bacterium]
MPSFSTSDSLRVRDYRLLWMGQLSTSLGPVDGPGDARLAHLELTGSAVSPGFHDGDACAADVAVRRAGGGAGRSLRAQGSAQLIIAQVTHAILNLTLATLVLLGEPQPWHVFTTAFLAGTVQAFQQPARQTQISDIVGNEKLMNALALNSTAVNCSRTFGPALSGIFIATVGIEGSYVRSEETAQALSPAAPGPRH